MKTKMFLVIGMLLLFALGFASPASADTLVNESEEPFEIGTTVTATSEDLAFTLGGGSTSSCKEATVEAEMTENGPEQVTLVPFKSTMSGCKSDQSNQPITVTSLTIGTINMSGGEASASFKSTELFGFLLIPCGYGGTLDFTYETGTDVLTVPGSWVFNEGPPNCPWAKEATGNFQLTGNGEPAFFE